MNRKKWLAIVWVCMGLAGTAPAVEVISIDINNYGNDTVYSGEAAVPGATKWVAYYGGWGVPLGSPRSANLASVGTIQGSTYAKQVWVGDYGAHDYITGAGDGLLDDGFVSNTVSDPNIIFIGEDMFGSVAGQLHAYRGTFDMYVYGNSPGFFYLVDPNGVSLADVQEVTGTETAGVFELGKNYVIFEDVSIAEPLSVVLVYTNELNGIQLVSKKVPFAVSATATDPNDMTLNAPDYDVAYDTNGREGENTFYGPDVSQDQVYYLDTGEYMEYDILVNAADEGQYALRIDVNTASGDVTLNIYLNGNLLGSLSQAQTGPATMGPLMVNLFEGRHVLRWQTPGLSGANIDNLVFEFVGPIVFNDCDEVYQYGFELPGDITGDCRVGIEDLAYIIADWADYFGPDSE